MKLNYTREEIHTKWKMYLKIEVLISVKTRKENDNIYFELDSFITFIKENHSDLDTVKTINIIHEFSGYSD